MILITGGMGYLGLHTARYLLDAGEDVVITRYSTWREPSFIKDEFGKRVLLEKVDVTSPNDVMRAVRAHKVTGIVHMAVPALGGLTPAEEYRVNTVGLLNVLDAAANSDVKRVSLASSVAVYSSVPEGPFHEDIPLPMTSKSGTETFKKGFEVHANYVADRTGLDVALLRINVNFGPLVPQHVAVEQPYLPRGRRGAPSRITPALQRGSPTRKTAWTCTTSRTPRTPSVCCSWRISCRIGPTTSGRAAG